MQHTKPPVFTPPRFFIPAKLGLLALALGTQVVLGGLTARAAEEAPSAETATDNNTYRLFYDKLADDGDWFQTNDYGYVFQPRVAADDRAWRPYTDGSWAQTDEGWTWISNEDFGWACYHYGRWANVVDAGWVWVPGPDWSPAYVSWRISKDHQRVGWAPLPPEARVSKTEAVESWVDNAYDIGPDAYTFIDTSHFGENSYRGHLIPVEQNTTIIVTTENVTRVSYRTVETRTVIYNGGPDVTVIREVTGRPVRELRLETRPENVEFFERGDQRRITEINGSSLVVATAAPDVITSTAIRVSVPAHVNRQLTSVTVDRGYRGIRDPQEAERLRAVVKARQEADDIAANRARRQQIEREVERLRGLRFLQPVDYHEIPRSDLPVILRQKLAQQVPDQEFESSGAALAALGVLPAGIDLKKTYLALLGEQIGAFYDQHDKGLFTFTGQPLTSSTNRVVMAHELTHALEDQHFDLARLPIEAKGNDDRALAATALVEGDATLVMNRYMTGDLSAASLREALGSALTTDVRQLAAAPRYLRESLLFPYLRGQEFCQALYERGGWLALDEAFRHPPSSSAQILHPDLYLADPREEPVLIPLPDAEIDGQRPTEDNVLGEFGVRQLFADRLHDKARAEEAASGWRGDHYLVYQSPTGTSYGWKVACRDRAAAKKLYEAACDTNKARYHPEHLTTKQTAPLRSLDPLDAPKEASTLSSMAFGSGERGISLRLTSANEVVVIDAQDAHWYEALARVFAL